MFPRHRSRTALFSGFNFIEGMLRRSQHHVTAIDRDALFGGRTQLDLWRPGAEIQTIATRRAISDTIYFIDKDFSLIPYGADRNGVSSLKYQVLT